MGFRPISKDVKERALYLLDCEWKMQDVVTALGVSERSVKQWKKNVALYGSVVPPLSPVRGRPRSLNPLQQRAIYDHIRQFPDLYLHEVQEWLAIHHDVILSTSTLDLNLQEMGLTYKKLRRSAGERDEGRRAEFMDFMRTNFRKEQLVVTDESSKDNRTIYRTRGRAPSGSRAEIRQDFGRGQRFSILPAMSVNGYEAVRIIEGSVTGPEFFDFIVEDVLPKMNPYPQDQSILVLDNCSIHKSDILREVVEGYGCLMYFLPPYSPDFNPIEESFSCVKGALRSRWRTISANHFPEADIYEACASVTADKADAWFTFSGYL